MNEDLKLLKKQGEEKPTPEVLPATERPLWCSKMYKSHEDFMEDVFGGVI